MKIIGYVIESGDTPTDLQEAVERRIKQGLIPQGGVAATNSDIREYNGIPVNYTKFYQAMVEYAS